MLPPGFHGKTRSAVRTVLETEEAVDHRVPSSIRAEFLYQMKLLNMFQ